MKSYLLVVWVGLIGLVWYVSGLRCVPKPDILQSYKTTYT